MNQLRAGKNYHRNRDEEIYYKELSIILSYYLSK